MKPYKETESYANAIACLYLVTVKLILAMESDCAVLIMCQILLNSLYLIFI